jgi:uncharacterized protein YegP (UPF0339 family)
MAIWLSRLRNDSRYTPSASQRRRTAMAHKFVIKKTENGQYRAYFSYNRETIFWTETYTSRAAAQNAVDSIKRNGPDAPVEEE